MKNKDKYSFIHGSRMTKRNINTQYNRWVIIFFAVLTFIFYGNTLRNGYSLDDDFVIENNPRIQQGIIGIPSLFVSPYTKELRQSYGYRPLTLATFAFEYELFGFNPRISHLVNVLLYGLTCIMLFYFLLILLDEYTKWLPFLIVFLFLIHPIHTEVVNSIKNRDELLSFLFSVASMFFFFKYYDSGKTFYLIAGLFVWLLASLSKLTAVIFIAAAPATIYFFRSMHRTRFIKLSVALLSFFLLLFLATRLIPQTESIRIHFYFENPLFSNNVLSNRIYTAFFSLAYYTRLLFFPHPLSFYYGYNQLPVEGWSNSYVLAGICIAIALFWFFWKGFKSKKFHAFAILVFALFLMPFLNLVSPVSGIIGERLSYGASFGFSCIISYGLLLVFLIPVKKTDKHNPVKNIFISFLAVIALMCSVKIISRNLNWKDRLTLYRSDIGHLNQSAKANSLLADAALKAAFETRNPAVKQNLLAESESHYKKALEIFPEYPMVLNNLGSIYFMFRNDYPKSKEYFERAVKADTASPEANFNLGLSLLKLNDTLNAVAYFKEAVRLYPQYHDALRYLSANTLMLKQYGESLEASKQAIRFFPSEGLFLLNSGKACLGMNDTLKARGFFEKLIAHPQREYREEAESMLQLLK